MRHYDYIITGAGAAGLSLLTHLIRSGRFQEKKILLLDKAPKNKNDRTWCFWEKGMGLFESIVYKRWNTLWFHSEAHSSLHNISPYQYKLIRGIDFYNYCFDIIREQPSVTVEYGDVAHCYSDEKETYVLFNGEKISSAYIFNSIRFETTQTGKKNYNLLQHFEGWVIETEEVCFNPGEAVLMDFRTDQHFGTTFIYVMPFSSTEALVEYTVFSEKLLEKPIYEQGLSAYCRDYLNVGSYKIISQESGAIPMTNHPFKKRSHNIINIGTAGGQTKASSGYTFQFIQKNSQKITEALIEKGNPFTKESIANRRFKIYDDTLLNILTREKLPGADIFTLLMTKNKMSQVMKFLDNETSISEELKLIYPLPKGVFIKAAFQSL